MDRKFDTIESVAADIRKGRTVIVVDDADRENEGDLIIAAQHVTPTAVNFMARHGRGLICVPTYMTRPPTRPRVCYLFPSFPRKRESRKPPLTAVAVTLDARFRGHDE